MSDAIDAEAAEEETKVVREGAARGRRKASSCPGLDALARCVVACLRGNVLLRGKRLGKSSLKGEAILVGMHKYLYTLVALQGRREQLCNSRNG